YQEKGLLVPAAVDAASGYRYYNDANLEKARAIVALRQLDFSLDEIAEILRDFADESDLVAYLERHKAELAERICRQEDIVSLLDLVIVSETAARGLMRAASFTVEMKTVAPQWVAGIRFRGKYSDCGSRFATLGRAVGRYMAGPPLCLYYDAEYREDDADIEACLPLRKQVSADGIAVRELPGGCAATLLHRGPYELLGRTYAKILKHVRQQDDEITSPCREVYLKGPGMIFRGNPNKYLTEIQMPLAHFEQRRP
ncbi:MAG: MerR family transcriptional regulator, partial [Candidatus Saccharimonadales bacterium]